MKSGEDRIIDGYRRDGWVTEKQFRKLHPAHLRYIGKWNKSKKHKPKSAVPGKTNKDYPDKRNAYNKKREGN